MTFSKFFKTPGHKRFDYVPRHWNPKKEDLEKRLENARKRNSDDTESMKARISTGMRRGSFRRDGKDSHSFRSNMLLLGIVIILVGVTYLLLVQYFPYFLDSMGLEPPANPQ